MQQNTRKILSLVRQPQFKINEFVWAHVRGFAYWPGVIEEIEPKDKFTIHFFGDYTRATVGRNAISHFLEGFEQYSNNKNRKLQKAVKEARILLLDKETIDECLVCKLLVLRKEIIEKSS